MVTAGLCWCACRIAAVRSKSGKPQQHEYVQCTVADLHTTYTTKSTRTATLSPAPTYYVVRLAQVVVWLLAGLAGAGAAGRSAAGPATT